MSVLVCLSGGLDSAVVLDMMSDQDRCEAISFDYGQPHRIELDYAKRLARVYRVAHKTVTLPRLPLVDDVVFAGRNLVLASFAIADAAASGLKAVAFGCNQSDGVRFPDCLPGFWDAVRGAAVAYGVSVLTPLIFMTKTRVVEEAKRRGVVLDNTWSCYSPVDGKPCGVCLACETRIQAGG